MSVQNKLPVIVAGAGLVGVLLGQLLKQNGIPFEIYDRDEGLGARYGGWAISLHWIEAELKRVLPEDMYERIKAGHVDPETYATGSIPFKYLDMETGKPTVSFTVPSYLRVSRFLVRSVLADGLNIQWATAVRSFEPVDDGVLVRLSNGKTTRGSMMIACDGKNSVLKRSIVDPEHLDFTDLPIELVGCKVRLDPPSAKKLLAVNPIMWQGAHPRTRSFFFFSLNSTPHTNGTTGTDDEYYEAQFNYSWIAEQGQEQPKTSAARLRRLKDVGSTFFSPLREAIEAVRDDVQLLDIKIQDWQPAEWDNQGGRVTILGDAAHAMTMYRGEGVNHGMYDAIKLVEQLRLWEKGTKSLAEAVTAYEDDMRPRAREGVLLSRQACLDAHYVEKVHLGHELFGYRDRL
ncbi:hypothetical protein ACHAPT_008134 [Fusarium lateritium]